MKTTRSLFSTGLLAATLTALAAPAFAQGDCWMMGDGQRDPAAFQQDMAQRRAMRTSGLHDNLKLTPEQEPAWKAYVDTMPTPPAMSAADRQAWSKLTTPERMEKMQEFAAARFTRMNEHLAATKELYAALTTEQKQVFDAQSFGFGNQKSNKRSSRSGKGQSSSGGPGMGGGMR